MLAIIEKNLKKKKERKIRLSFREGILDVLSLFYLCLCDYALCVSLFVELSKLIKNLSSCDFYPLVWLAVCDYTNDISIDLLFSLPFSFYILSVGYLDLSDNYFKISPSWLPYFWKRYTFSILPLKCVIWNWLQYTRYTL